MDNLCENSDIRYSTFVFYFSYGRFCDFCKLLTIYTYYLLYIHVRKSECPVNTPSKLGKWYFSRNEYHKVVNTKPNKIMSME
jgi:hypothetical protein